MLVINTAAVFARIGTQLASRSVICCVAATAVFTEFSDGSLLVLNWFIGEVLEITHQSEPSQSTPCSSCTLSHMASHGPKADPRERALILTTLYLLRGVMLYHPLHCTCLLSTHAVSYALPCCDARLLDFAQSRFSIPIALRQGPRPTADFRISNSVIRSTSCWLFFEWEFGFVWQP